MRAKTLYSMALHSFYAYQIKKGAGRLLQKL